MGSADRCFADKCVKEMARSKSMFWLETQILPDVFFFLGEEGVPNGEIAKESKLEDIY